MRAARWTASPATSSPVRSTSPVCRPVRTSSPSSAASLMICRRAAHALCRAGEQGQHAVAGRLDGLAAVRCDGGARRGEVTVEHARPGAISRSRGAPRGVDEVGEQHRRQDAVRRAPAGGAPVTNSSMMSAMSSTSSAKTMAASPGTSRSCAPGMRSANSRTDVRGNQLLVTRVDDERRCLDQRKRIGDVARQRHAQQTSGLSRGRRRLKEALEPVVADRVGRPLRRVHRRSAAQASR